MYLYSPRPLQCYQLLTSKHVYVRPFCQHQIVFSMQLEERTRRKWTGTQEIFEEHHSYIHKHYKDKGLIR